MFGFFNRKKNFFPKVWNNDKNKRTKVFVAVSGGVDSSVSLRLLQQRGYDVEGVFFKKYNLDKEKCQREKDDARKVCEQLDVPFHFLDLEKEYKDKILNYFIESYKKGETPNPDIMCNKYIKFGAFLRYAEKNSADFIATGHYAKNLFRRDGLFFLAKAKDKNKDQTYFLALLSQYQLSRTIFPLGDLKKPAVRRLAKKYGLLTAEKKDSQGVCFLGKKIKLEDFLKKHIKYKTGNLLNIKGEIIGRHKGVPFYTIGQRYGFEISPKFKTTNQKRLFVIKKSFENNTITVDEKHLVSKKITIKNINWISGEPEWELNKFQGRIRYRGELIAVKLVKRYNDTWNLYFKKEHRAISSGQFVVIYDKNLCLGAGEII